MKYSVWVATAVISVCALTLATHTRQSPEEKLRSQDQEAIDGCWQESRGTALTPSQRQVVIGACQKLEEVYRYNWGGDPRSAAVGV